MVVVYKMLFHCLQVGPVSWEMFMLESSLRGQAEISPLLDLTLASPYPTLVASPVLFCFSLSLRNSLNKLYALKSLSQALLLGNLIQDTLFQYFLLSHSLTLSPESQCQLDFQKMFTK